MPRVVAVVLAGGTSRRMGKPKLVLRVGKTPVLERVLSVFRSSKVGAVVVVLGADEETVRKAVKFRDEKVVVNKEYAEGMSASLRAGLEAVPEEADAVMIALGDQPFIRPATIDRIIDAYADSGASVVAPVFAGRRGNPVLFARRMFSALKEIRGDHGAKYLIERNTGGLVELEVEDVGVVADIDTPQDYRKFGSSARKVRKKRSPAGSVRAQSLRAGSGKRPRGRPRSRQRAPGPKLTRSHQR